MSSVEEDKKPAADPSPFVNLKVKGQDKGGTQLRKLMNAYCVRQSIEFDSIVFLFDGCRLQPEQTPNEMEMEDGDEIDVMSHQTGGAAAW